MSIAPEIADRLIEIGKYSSPVDKLLKLSALYNGAISFSTSFGEEDQVITEMIAKNKIPIRIFSLDTGRLFQESYDLADITRSKYALNIEVYYPNNELVESLTLNKGFNSFYKGIEERKECCNIRKIEPLNRALKGSKVWITGLRSAQSENRLGMQSFEYDNERELIKFNPLIDWTDDELKSYINLNKIPINSLHSRGYKSIGCAPCTRAIMPGEHPRAGRWWWENSGKECGLHSNR